MTTDDISFKVLIDAWSPGIVKSLFVSTASPIFLALTLVPLFVLVQKISFLLEYEEDGGKRKRRGSSSSEHGPFYESFPLQNQNDDSFANDNLSNNNNIKLLQRRISFPKPRSIHIPLALLDHGTTLLATIGGQNTPGHMQVLINQTMLPLTAFISHVALERRYTFLQIASSMIIVCGTIFAGFGTLSTSVTDDSHDGSMDDTTNDDDDDDAQEEQYLLLGKGLSICLFFMAQIPNAISSVWKEYILKKQTTMTMMTTKTMTASSSSSSMANMTEMVNYKLSEHQHDEEEEEEEEEKQHHPQHESFQQNTNLFQSNNKSRERICIRDDNDDNEEEYLSTPLRIIHLATCISILRSIIAIVSFLIFSLYITSSSNNNDEENPIKQSILQFLTNTQNGTVLLLLNDMTYVYSKLTHLRVMSEKGGAFLSVLAGAIALPVQILLFRMIYGKEKEGLGDLTCVGVILTMVGMGLYIWAVPDQFGSSADMFCGGGGEANRGGAREEVGVRGQFT